MAQKTYSRTRKEFVLECFSGAQFHSEPREAKLFTYHETVHGKNEIFKYLKLMPILTKTI